jgi:mycofactocin precursor
VASTSVADRAILDTDAQAPATAEPGGLADDVLVTEELLVEEVSIDGMCGVY